MNSNSDVINTSMSTRGFWKSVEILLEKPHVINKRLWGCDLLFRWFGEPSNTDWKLPLSCTNFDQECIEDYKNCIAKEFALEKCNTLTVNANMVEIVLLKLFPKFYSESHAFQLVCLQKNLNIVTFYDVTPAKLNQNLTPDFSYTLQLVNNQLILKTMCDNTSKSYNWLVAIFLPQVVKWGEETLKGTCNKHIAVESICLVSKERYYKKYNDLKLTYGKEMVKIWPECTDPTKFVYEDVAIATYLLLLWENEQEHSSKTFVDLGCGNGLLVYILTKEGHKGFGIDLQKRQIWQLYPDNVKLEVKTIVPSDENLFPETDWVIGNHSDELTPWIPVIAARSSYKCNFFLLPCCAYNFDGTKYQRKDSSKSQYTEYLQYIQYLSKACGFKTDIDRLKIPSTKRICLIGRGRIYEYENYYKYCNSIKDLLIQETNPTLQSNNYGAWVKDFKPRESVEKVRNCTQIDKSVVESIVNDITNYLLEDVNLHSNWSPGKSVTINELVTLIAQDKLNVLKSEFGGLQTLLKNNNHIFMVQSGMVQLRYPRTVEQVNNNVKTTKINLITIKVQQKPCWFYNKHPQGCPLSDSNCSFLHKKG